MRILSFCAFFVISLACNLVLAESFDLEETVKSGDYLFLRKYTMKDGDVISEVIYKSRTSAYGIWGKDGLVELTRKLNPKYAKLINNLPAGTELTIPYIPKKGKDKIFLRIMVKTVKPGESDPLSYLGDHTSILNKTEKYVIKNGEFLSEIFQTRVFDFFHLYQDDGLIARMERDNVGIEFDKIKVGTIFYICIIPAFKELSLEQKIEVEKVVQLKDKDPPLPPTELSFMEGNESKYLEITANWKKSESKDVKQQLVVFYADDACQIIIDQAIDLKSVDVEQSTYRFSSPGEYTFRIISIDRGNNKTLSKCSDSIKVGTTIVPTATQLSFDGKSPTNLAQVTARWKKSIYEDRDKQTIVFYEGQNCTGKIIGSYQLTLDQEAHNFKPDKDGLISFQIIDVDDKKEIKSSCSKPILVDRQTPKVASGLIFKERSPYSKFTVTASWIVSESLDLKNQHIQLYKDEKCQKKINGTESLDSNSLSSYQLTVTDNGYYSYKIVSFDKADNESYSECSTPIKINSTSPSPANKLVFEGKVLTNKLKLKATWIRSNSSDLKKQYIQLFMGNKCNQALTHLEELKDGAVEEKYFDFNKSGKYTFKVTSVDAAGNRTSSGCSKSVEIDIEKPLVATGLNFKEGKKQKKMYITPLWTASVSSDVSAQKVIFYDDENCNDEVGPPIVVSGKDKESFSYVVPKVATYTFKVITMDNAGNFSESLCSSSIEIDHGYTPFSLLLAKEETASEELEKYGYVGERLAVEYEIGLVSENGLTQTQKYDHQYPSTRLTLHTKPLSLFKFLRKNNRISNVLANLYFGFFYQRGMVDYDFVNSSSGATSVKAYPQTFGLYLYEYFLKNKIVNNLKIGPQIIIEKYSLGLEETANFRDLNYTSFKMGLTANYVIPRLISNITIDLNYSPTVSYTENPEPAVGKIDSVSMLDASVRLLRRFSRKTDLGVGYDYKKITVSMRGADNFNHPEQSNHKFGLFLMWHYE